MKGIQGGYVDRKIAQSIGVALTLLVSFYFFAPGILMQQAHPQIDVSAQSAESQDISSLGNAVTLPALPQKTEYSVYFNNLKLDSGKDCKEVHPVSRTIEGANPEAAALLDLLKGPTAEEKTEGYSSAFSDKTALSLQSLAVRDGIAAVGLADIRKIVPNVSTSCGSQAFIAAVENTLFQFDGIHKVLFAIEGSPKKFYNWIQMSCGVDNNNCDASMFK